MAKRIIGLTESEIRVILPLLCREAEKCAGLEAENYELRTELDETLREEESENLQREMGAMGYPLEEPWKDDTL